jgi:hypothetical protein
MTSLPYSYENIFCEYIAHFLQSNLPVFQARVRISWFGWKPGGTPREGCAICQKWNMRFQFHSSQLILGFLINLA